MCHLADQKESSGWEPEFSDFFPAQVLLGVRVNASEASRLVDMGPGAEDSAAASDFRAFWGDKAELRRFPVSRFPYIYLDHILITRPLLLGNLTAGLLSHASPL